MSFFEADGGVCFSYKHLVNLNPHTTDVMAVSHRTLPPHNHGSVEKGSFH